MKPPTHPGPSSTSRRPGSGDRLDLRDLVDLDRAIRGGLHRVPHGIPLVVPPGCVNVATNVVAAHLGGEIVSEASRLQRLDEALTVHDVVTDGAQIDEAQRRLAGLGFAGRLQQIAVFAAPGVHGLLDHTLAEIGHDTVLEWRIMTDPILQRSCVDIDGILCLDPTVEENDDGLEYRSFLQCAVPRWRPTERVGWLVTSRLEKYRPETEAWLDRNGVRYDELIMLDLPSAEARRAAGSHGSYKAEVYASVPAILFIESERWQAATIARLADKPVLCLPEGRLVRPEQVPVPTTLQRVRTRIGRAVRELDVRLRRPTHGA